MKTYQACVPCIKKLMESTLNKTDLDDLKKQVILDKFKEDWVKADMSLPPARTAGLSYQKVLQETAQDDLFKAHKKFSIQEALKLYPRLKNLADDASDPLEMAIRISALGNILDAANPNNYNLEDEITRLMDVQIVGDSQEIFRNKLSSADSLLILADNAGEAVFDKVLIETIDVPTIYAVKSKPAFDDALLADARQAGIDQVAQIIETGTPYPGTYLPSCTPEFQDIFTNAPLVLAKGQANFETLSDASRDLFFLLKVKCEVVSREMNFPIGSLTLKYHQD
jgi:uncharacterized protein with ATP-grasp and redox domains